MKDAGRRITRCSNPVRNSFSTRWRLAIGPVHAGTCAEMLDTTTARLVPALFAAATAPVGVLTKILIQTPFALGSCGLVR